MWGPSALWPAARPTDSEVRCRTHQVRTKSRAPAVATVSSGAPASAPVPGADSIAGSQQPPSTYPQMAATVGVHSAPSRSQAVNQSLRRGG